MGGFAGAFSAATDGTASSGFCPEKVHAEGDGVGADDSALARIAASAEVFGVGLAFHLEPGAVAGVPLLHHTAQHRRLPFRTEHPTGRNQGAGLLDDLPACELHKEGLG